MQSSPVSKFPLLGWDEPTPVGIATAVSPVEVEVATGVDYGENGAEKRPDRPEPQAGAELLRLLPAGTSFRFCRKCNVAGPAILPGYRSCVEFFPANRVCREATVGRSPRPTVKTVRFSQRYLKHKYPSF